MGDYALLGVMHKPKARARWPEYLGSPLGWPGAMGDWLNEDHEPSDVDGLGILEDERCVYFGVDSGDPTDEEALARGYISPEVTSRLAERLGAYGDGTWTRVVLLHHHPLMRKASMALRGADRLMKAVKGNCELLLFGHKHDYGIWHGKHDIPLIVTSHKSTNLFAGECLTVTCIDIHRTGTQEASFNHRLRSSSSRERISDSQPRRCRGRDAPCHGAVRVIAENRDEHVSAAPSRNPIATNENGRFRPGF